MVSTVTYRARSNRAEERAKALGIPYEGLERKHTIHFDPLTPNAKAMMRNLRRVQADSDYFFADLETKIADGVTVHSDFTRIVYESMKQQYTDLKYLWGGREKEVGLDCLSAASYIRKEFYGRGINLDLPELRQIYSLYPKERDMPWDYPLVLTQELCEVRDDPEPGDLVVFKSAAGPSCMGLLLSNRLVGFMTHQGGRISTLDKMCTQVQGIFDPANVLEPSL